MEDEYICSSPAGQAIGGLIGDYRVTGRAADGVLNQGSRVAVVQERIRNIASRGVEVAQIG